MTATITKDESGNWKLTGGDAIENIALSAAMHDLDQHHIGHLLQEMSVTCLDELHPPEQAEIDLSTEELIRREGDGTAQFDGRV